MANCPVAMNAGRGDPGRGVDYTLPPMVASIREGWQWTCSSGAVVSGLLAGGAAQLLSLFRSSPPYDHQNIVLGFCYAALFLNISATIGSFIITDNLGEIQFRSSNRNSQIGNFDGNDQNALLHEYGVSRAWNCMLWHWLATFYLGILTLIGSVLAFVWLQENLAIAVAMTVIVASTLIPISIFIFGGRFYDKE